MTYDSLDDTLAHRARINTLLLEVAMALIRHANQHDLSKLVEPEKSMFDTWRPVLDAHPVDSDEYREALGKMGAALQHHYAANRHHPEHFENGVNDMTLIDVIEMVCDWFVSAERKGERVNLDWARKRFSLDAQMSDVIANTLVELERPLVKMFHAPEEIRNE